MAGDRSGATVMLADYLDDAESQLVHAYSLTESGADS